MQMAGWLLAIGWARVVPLLQHAKVSQVCRQDAGHDQMASICTAGARSCHVGAVPSICRVSVSWWQCTDQSGVAGNSMITE